MKLRKTNKLAIFKNSYDFLFKYFCVVVVVILTISFINAQFEGAEWTINGADLARIFLISFFGVAPSMIATIFIETSSPKGVRIKNAIRFLATAFLVIGTYAVIGSSSGGVTFSTIATFLIAYAAVSIYSFFNAMTIEIKEKDIAEQINNRLNEIHNAKNESHID